MTEDIPVDTPREPQALGVFAFPLGLLLLEDGPDFEAVTAELALGIFPRELPAEYRFLSHVQNQNLEAAYDEIRSDSFCARYNRFVLSPSEQAYEALLRDSNSETRPLVESIGFMLGFTDEISAPARSEGNMAAWIFSCLAATEIAKGNPTRAQVHLLAGIDALDEKRAIFASLLRVNYAQLLKEDPGHINDAIAMYEKACPPLADSDLAQECAGAMLELGLCYQELGGRNPAKLKDAVRNYHGALLKIDKLTSPELYGALQVNLALAYLAMPMIEASDALRQAVAISSLKEALTVFDKVSHPQEWSNVQMNLANALVYLPSAHQGDNLVDAVERYEELLCFRDRVTDPIGFARIVVNQGNALAHLGDFEHAKAKLHEARMIFEEFAMFDEVRTIRGLLDEIVKQSMNLERAENGIS